MTWGTGWKKHLARRGLLPDAIAAPDATPGKVRRRAVQHEYREQKSLFEWAGYARVEHPELRLLHATMNGLPSDPVAVAKAKRAGLVPGVSDVFLPVARGGFHGLWIEMKVAPNRPTPEQETWMADMAAEGYAAFVAYTWIEARNLITAYLTEPRTGGLTRRPEQPD